MSVYKKLKNEVKAIENNRLQDARFERGIREHLSDWDANIRKFAKMARHSNDGCVHEPIIPDDYCCPFCNEELKGKKIGVMHGRKNIRAHEKCYTQAILHDPSGTIYSHYKVYDLYLSEHKMQAVYHIIGTIYNQIVDLLTDKQDVPQVETLEIEEAEPVVDETDYVREAKANKADVFNDLNVNRNTTIIAYDEIEEYLDSKMTYDTVEDRQQVLDILIFLHTMRKMKVENAFKMMQKMSDEEYFAILEAVQDNDTEEEPETLKEIASSSNKTKKREYMSNSRRMEALLAEFNAIK